MKFKNYFNIYVTKDGNFKWMYLADHMCKEAVRVLKGNFFLTDKENFG